MSDEDLKPCPFCGGSAVRKFTGNDYTKSRKVTVSCKGCHCTMVVGAIRFSHEWCDKTVIEKWNNRVSTESTEEA